MWKELLQNKKAVIFDLDGTLIDSLWIWKQIDIDCFKMWNIEFPQDYQERINGMSFYETAVFTHNEYGIDLSVDDMMKLWNDMAYYHYSSDIDVKSGVNEFLQVLKNKGFKIGIATSNSNILCKAVLTNTNIINFFDAIVTGDECLKGKPEPDVYLFAANQLGVNPEECIVFEDICEGIKAGNNANMTTVAVWDEHSKDCWNSKISDADYYIESYKEILDEILTKR